MQFNYNEFFACTRCQFGWKFYNEITLFSVIQSDLFHSIFSVSISLSLSSSDLLYWIQNSFILLFSHFQSAIVFAVNVLVYIVRLQMPSRFAWKIHCPERCVCPMTFCYYSSVFVDIVSIIIIIIIIINIIIGLSTAFNYKCISVKSVRQSLKVFSEVNECASGFVGKTFKCLIE